MIPPRQPLPPPPPITLSKLLLVEGITLVHFCEALLRHLGADQAIEIRNFGGVRDFKTFAIDLANESDFKQRVISLGVVRDAEGDALGARSSVDAALAAASLSPAVRTSVFILPDNSRPGMIETLCVEALKNEPASASVCACVDEFFGCLRQRKVVSPGFSVPAKHWAQAYLASRDTFQQYVGVAAYHNCWPFDNSAFSDLKQFLQGL